MKGTPKVIAVFEERMLEWGAALIEHKAAERACRAVHGGWPDTKSPEFQRALAAEKKLDELRGPMHTALNRAAEYRAK